MKFTLTIVALALIAGNAYTSCYDECFERCMSEQGNEAVCWHVCRAECPSAQLKAAPKAPKLGDCLGDCTERCVNEGGNEAVCWHICRDDCNSLEKKEERVSMAAFKDDDTCMDTCTARCKCSGEKLDAVIWHLCHWDCQNACVTPECPK